MGGYPGSFVADTPQDKLPEDSTLRVQGLPTADNRWSVLCLNCESPLQGQFCGTCGQRAVPPHPTVRELAGDAVAEFLGWDGKFAETLKLLVTKPGELTRQWLDGRRVRFIAPLRLYLTASLVFFILQAAAPGNRSLKVDLTGPRANPVSVGKSKPQIAADAASKALETGTELTAAERDSATRAIATAPAYLRPFLTRVTTDPNGFKASLRAMVPRMLFLLLPFYAGGLAIFYRRRHYPEHLYFAIHLHAFVFLALIVIEGAKILRLNANVVGVAGLGVMLWIAVYSLAALRKVYGGSWPRTVAKGVGIMTLYGIIAFPVMFVALIIAALV